MMDQVQSQVRLPFPRAFQIAVQGIRIRLGRSLVTLSGVVLGIAFLMSNLTGQLIKNAVAAQREVRQKTNMMLVLVRAEVGEVRGRNLAVAAMGSLEPAEQLLLQEIRTQEPAALRGFGAAFGGVETVPLARLAKDADLLLVLGGGQRVPASLGALAEGMRQKVILDSRSDRAFEGTADASVRRELFFGTQHEQQKAKLAQEASKNRARTLWIVFISILVTTIGVSNALLMSVTERFREIGTMKCLGALSRFIRTLFLIESSLIGFAGSVIGAILGALLPMVAYGFTYSFPQVFGSMPYGWLVLAAAASTIAGTVLSVVAALYPARFASRMVPASALRSTV